MTAQGKEVKFGRQWVALLDVVDTVHGVRADRSDEKTVELARSIKDLGLINALTCVARDGELILVAGHRRYAACEMVGMTKVPVNVVEMTDAEIKGVVFAENFHREDPTPMEEAQAIEQAIGEGYATEEEVAQAFSRSVTWVRDRVKLLSIPEDCQVLLHEGRLSVGSVRHLAKVTDDDQRKHLLHHAIAGGINERTARAWLQAWEQSVPMADVILTEGEPAKYVPLDRQAECPCLVCNRMGEPGLMTNVLICRACVETIRATPGG